MSDYALHVNFGTDEEPLRLTLTDYRPSDAETARQALERRIEHAIELDAPVVFSAATDDDPQAGVPIDPHRVTGVDLVALTSDES